MSKPSDSKVAPNELLHNSIRLSDIEGVKRALVKGADIHSWRGEYKNTALHAAVILPDMAIAKYLVEQGADFSNIQNGQFQTVYQRAIDFGRLEIVAFLNAYNDAQKLCKKIQVSSDPKLLTF